MQIIYYKHTPSNIILRKAVLENKYYEEIYYERKKNI